MLKAWPSEVNIAITVCVRDRDGYGLSDRMKQPGQLIPRGGSYDFASNFRHRPDHEGMRTIGDLTVAMGAWSNNRFGTLERYVAYDEEPEQLEPPYYKTDPFRSGARLTPLKGTELYIVPAMDSDGDGDGDDDDIVVVKEVTGPKIAKQTGKKKQAGQGKQKTTKQPAKGGLKRTAVRVITVRTNDSIHTAYNRPSRPIYSN